MIDLGTLLEENNQWIDTFEPKDATMVSNTLKAFNKEELEKNADKFPKDLNLGSRRVS